MEDKMVNLDAVTNEALTMSREAVRKLTDILCDENISYASKVGAIVTAGRMLEKLDYISEFSSFYVYSDKKLEVRDRIQFIINNDLDIGSFKHMVI